MRVFLATDGSPESFAAIREVLRILSPDRDSLLFYYSPFGPAKILGYDEGVLKHSRELLSEAVFSRALAGLPHNWPGGVEKIVGSKDPRAEIFETAEAQATDLIVVGARGLGPFKRMLLGSVSHAVAHLANVPVFIGRPKRGTAPADHLNVLLPCESALSGRRLVDFLRQFTWPPDATARLMSVINTVFPGKLPDRLRNPKRTPEIEAMIAGWVRAQTATLETAKEELAELSLHYPPGIRAAPPLICEGLAEREIVDAAKREHAGLIVMGSKESTPWGRLFIGSTADAVMNHAPCSVLLVRHAAA